MSLSRAARRHSAQHCVSLSRAARHHSAQHRIAAPCCPARPSASSLSKHQPPAHASPGGDSGSGPGSELYYPMVGQPPPPVQMMPWQGSARPLGSSGSAPPLPPPQDARAPLHTAAAAPGRKRGVAELDSTGSSAPLDALVGMYLSSFR
eukprot:TRINITY_DN1571_c1_g1_i2.p2 TRINITY_DN1571_c1_g1~~TRINITY_DN1571_c1_g1_i2.p2  ORF type:complete len:149 (+),score=44.48 TRINITY_DN1571_c1_g1_i2:421-867(+)